MHEITNALNSMVNALMGQTVHQSEYECRRGRFFQDPRRGQMGKFSSTTTEDRTTASLTWDTGTICCTTRPMMFSSRSKVASRFWALPATATLAVSLKVQTRYHTNVITLGGVELHLQRSSPGENIRRGQRSLGRSSPQIRAIFALYTKSRTPSRAHYVTAAEEANGALPFHGFNFVLRLQMYDSIGTINAENASQHEIHMVPCNLLEMLYAFVFSQEYGVSQYERYPVTMPRASKALQESLFSSTVRVHIRDGAVHDWLDALGHPYIDDTTTELYPHMMKTQNLGPFLGINNRLPDFAHVDQKGITCLPPTTWTSTILGASGAGKELRWYRR